MHDDAGSQDAVMDPDGAAPLGPWQAPTPLDILAVADDDPSATGDLLELYFNRDNDIYVTKRGSMSEPWDTPVAVAELDSADAETTPEVSYDGLTIYFASARAGTLGGNDIWRSSRASRAAAWSTPVHVIELSSAGADGAAASTDPRLIMIDSDRAGTLDVFVAQRAMPSGAFGTPAAVDELNSADSDGNPMLAPDGLTVYFDSNRGGDGAIYAATRTTPTATFAAPAAIAELSAPGDDTDPWISPDGRTLYFTSNRDGTLRLWQTTR
jgi:Tol biopolymer transport system component